MDEIKPNGGKSMPYPQKEIKAAEVVKQPTQVIATKNGFIYQERKKEGDVFILKSEKHFSDFWMKKI